MGISNLPVYSLPFAFCIIFKMVVPPQDHKYVICDYLFIISCIYFLRSGLSKPFVTVSCARWKRESPLSSTDLKPLHPSSTASSSFRLEWKESHPSIPGQAVHLALPLCLPSSRTSFPLHLACHCSFLLSWMISISARHGLIPSALKKNNSFFPLG